MKMGVEEKSWWRKWSACEKQRRSGLRGRAREERRRRAKRQGKDERLLAEMQSRGIGADGGGSGQGGKKSRRGGLRGW
jgi:hypothetical protein